jgi:hypothetical protein
MRLQTPRLAGMGSIFRPRTAAEQAQSEHNQHDGQERLPYPSQHHKRSPEERHVRATPEAVTTPEVAKILVLMPGAAPSAGIGSVTCVCAGLRVWPSAGIGSLRRGCAGLRVRPRSSTRSIEITAWTRSDSA